MVTGALKSCSVPVSLLSLHWVDYGTEQASGMDENRKQRLQILAEWADNHSWNNREEIAASERCLCTGCGLWLKPSEILKWYQDRHACCPDCGLTGVIVGSRSGLPLDEYRSNMEIE